MKSLGVITTYVNGGREYSSYIVAETMKEAEELRRQRNIGERITSDITTVNTLPDYRQLSDAEFLAQLPDVMKEAVFLGYVAFAAGNVSLEQTLGVHCVIERLAKISNKACPPYDEQGHEQVAKVRSELYALQLLAPGVFPAELAGYYITVKVAPRSVKQIDHIVSGSQVFNLGPAPVAICDCDNPDCGITDDDQPCGYEQTIEAALKGVLDTTAGTVYIHNHHPKDHAKVKIMVKGRKE